MQHCVYGVSVRGVEVAATALRLAAHMGMVEFKASNGTICAWQHLGQHSLNNKPPPPYTAT